MASLRFRRSLAAGLVASAVLLGAAACSASGGSPSKSELVLGVVGNNKDQIQPYTATSSASADALRQELYDGLTEYSDKGGVTMRLAESMTPNAALDVWTVKLRPDVKLHDGSAFTAADVIQSISYMLDPKNDYPASTQIDFVDPARITKVDDLTLEFHLKKPVGTFPEVWASRDLLMRGLDAKGEAVGTGPFDLVSFTAGQQAQLTRFDDYWSEKPGFKNLRLQFFQDQQAITNALRGGQIDVAYSVPFTDVASLKTASHIKTLVSESGAYMTLSMRVDTKPFSDPKVQEALKLVVDRKQIIDNAFGGFASIGDDYLGNNTDCPAPDVPQRTQDLAKAKKLLAEAGQSNLSIELATDGAFPGMMETAQLYAQQAAQAGVTVTVKKLDTATFLNGWGDWPFYIGYSGSPYVVTASTHFLPDGVENANHFNNPAFTKLVGEMMATSDHATQCALITTMQAIDYASGGNIVAAYPQSIVAYRDSVHGLKPDLWGRASTDFAGVTLGSK
ncbi:ABC transporter substrate-binding protein [Leifsonia poae]|uniref:ABC transporter substrate-binding protein n=1 Tax=Leifsonia poae TaxID=110933 RepID=UPI001CBAAA51|nr:ABC transporter substrate-binding protein [Leifsonia poae]